MRGPVPSSAGPKVALRKTAAWPRSFKSGLFSFAAALAAVACLIVWINSSIWRELARLEKGFADVKSEKFYFGVNFRVEIRKVIASCLDYALSGDPADYDAFRHDASQLKNWIAAEKIGAVNNVQRKRLAHLDTGYRDFLKRLEPLLETNATDVVRTLRFATAYLQVRQASRPLLELCDEAVEADRRGFDEFVRDSDADLLALQRVLLLSFGLLAALSACLALLVYRGMLAPLRAQLSESQALVARQEKLASLGALAAGLAHEIRNPLTALKFRLFSLRKSLPLDISDHEDARVISEEIARLDGILNSFLRFARPAGPKLARVRAESILQDVHELMGGELDSRGIDLRREVVHSAWIHADVSQLKQVLINLVQNSAESIVRHGVITLRLSRAMAELRGSSRAAVVIEVADTGGGIPPEVEKRLFDPFFTTKEGGTGLGLAIAARIVDSHGGVIQYHTEPSVGAVFEVVLPRLSD